MAGWSRDILFSHLKETFLDCVNSCFASLSLLWKGVHCLAVWLFSFLHSGSWSSEPVRHQGWWLLPASLSEFFCTGWSSLFSFLPIIVLFHFILLTSKQAPSPFNLHDSEAYISKQMLSLAPEQKIPFILPLALLHSCVHVWWGHQVHTGIPGSSSPFPPPQFSPRRAV